MGVFRQQKAIDRLEDRLATQAALISDLHRDYKSLDLEFTNLFDKVSRQMSRMAKRYAVDAKENGVDPEPDPPVSDELGMDPISAQIHARRNRMYLKP